MMRYTNTQTTFYLPVKALYKITGCTRRNVIVNYFGFSLLLGATVYIVKSTLQNKVLQKYTSLTMGIYAPDWNVVIAVKFFGLLQEFNRFLYILL